MSHTSSPSEGKQREHSQESIEDSQARLAVPESAAPALRRSAMRSNDLSVSEEPVAVHGTVRFHNIREHVPPYSEELLTFSDPETESDEEVAGVPRLEKFMANTGGFAPEGTDIELGQPHTVRSRGFLGLMLKLDELRNSSRNWSPSSHPSSAASTPRHNTSYFGSGPSNPRHLAHDPPFYLSSSASTPYRIPSPTPTHPSSGATTPRSFFSSSRTHSSNSISRLLESPSLSGLDVSEEEHARRLDEKLTAHKKKAEKKHLGRRVIAAGRATAKWYAQKTSKKRKIKDLIAATIDKHQFLMQLCRALIRYGAPTHRLEAYMRTCAESLSVAGQFLYTPGCMIISFDDPSTHTTEVKFIREPQDLDLGRMDSVHNVYKEVAKGDMTVKDARQVLYELMNRKPKHSKPMIVLMCGLGAASVGPFAFQARLIDTPIAFLLGCIVGLLQQYVNPVSELWANCFPILATILTSALARLFGSIRGGELFCFSALAQSSIALILPGFLALCGMLELLAGSVIAGSTRLVHALIYSLFLWFGITLGTAISGTILSSPSSSATCSGGPLPYYWFFLSVPVFTFCLVVINQAKWKQAPAQMAVSLAGYQVNFWIGRQIKVASAAAAAGTFTIGLLANWYGRAGYRYEQKLVRALSGSGPGTERERGQAASGKTGYGLAAATMLPAIWVQVPSGLAVYGSLVSGIETADAITGGRAAASATPVAGVVGVVGQVWSVGAAVMEVAVGLSVGLLMSSLLVYPRSKKRGGVFSM